MEKKKRSRKTTRRAPISIPRQAPTTLSANQSTIEGPVVPAVDTNSVEANPVKPNNETTPSFPIVGIGASAGGLAAFEAFFANMPSDTENGIAFVIVQHLDPGHKSILTDLVQRYTQMRVYEVEDRMAVEPNCTYIIPPNKDLALVHDRLSLLEPAAPRGMRLPIDFFFRSLAQDRGEQAICIVLSGAGTDGTLGLRAIKEVGGMAMVQSPESAGYDGMPRSAVATGLADYVLPPKEMPKQLIAYVQHVFGRKKKGAGVVSTDASSWIQRILVLLRTSSGHDFSCYKESTILRRVERRMAVHQIEQVDQYVQFLRTNEAEQSTLFRELLIGVTGFFRDPEAHHALQADGIDQLLANRPVGTSLRVWVPGCSSGEEAYSIAMLFQEQMEKAGRQFNLQLFATDIDQAAIERARVGLYPASIAADVTPERLRRYFVQESEDSYRIKKSIRDMVVFAEQDVIKDPPFSKIDLLSCRNLLIYMQAELQRKIMPVFHYALNPGGFLFLGSSETVGDFANLFQAVNRKWKLYQRREVALPHNTILEMPVHERAERAAAMNKRTESKSKKTNVRELTERTLLGDYAPACVAVNSQSDILYVFGRTGKYLELATGEINVNILRTAREGLRLELTTALRKVVSTRKPVRHEGLTVKTNGNTERVNLIVKPADLLSAESDVFLVIFEPVPPTRLPAQTSKTQKISASTDLDRSKDRHIAALERELRVKEEYLQTTIEELETANEELKSTNEELQSTNEELQSTNEELETSKEELQSVNEELVTVNTELQQKIEDLSRANNDMNNLLAGTGIGTIFVNGQLCLQRFTPAATRIIPLMQTDIGRPLEHFASNLASTTDLLADIQAVLDQLTPRQAEVQTKDGYWYLMRILPYRTPENVIEGVVLTFYEITEQKRLQETLRGSEERFRALVMASSDVLYRMSADWSEMRHLRSQDFLANTEAPTRDWLEKYIPPSDQSRVMAAIQNAIRTRSTFELEHRVLRVDGSPGWTFSRAIPILNAEGEITEWFGAASDITAHKRDEESRRRLALVISDANDAITAQDLQGRILAWNPAAERMYGWSETEALSMNIQVIVPREKRPETDAFVEKLVRGERVDPFETVRVAKNGQLLDVRLTVTALVDESGKPYAIATTERNITR